MCERKRIGLCTTQKKHSYVVSFAVLAFFLLLSSFSPSYADPALKKLVIIGTLDDYPIMYANQEGKATGLAVDVIEGFAKTYNYTLEFELYPAAKVEDVFKSHGDLMYVSGMLDQLNQPEDSLPFYYKNYALFTNDNDLTPNPTRSQLSEYLQNLVSSKQEIGIREQNQTKHNLKQQLEDLPFLGFETNADLLKALSSGQIHHALMPNELGHKLLNEAELKSFKEIPMTLYIEESTFRIHPNRPDILYKLNHYLISIKKNNQLNQLTFSWFNEKAKGFGNNTFLMYFNIVGVISIVIVLALAYKNVIMQRVINQKTEEIVKQVRVNEQLYEQLLKEAQYKNNYFMNLSHELRTPISLVLNASQMADLTAKQPSEDAKRKLTKYTNIISNNSYRLLRIITHLIDLNRLEASELKLKRETLDIVLALDLIIQELTESDYIDLDNVHIHTEENEMYLDADAYELSRILVSLIGFTLRNNPTAPDMQFSILQDETHIELHYQDNSVLSKASLDNAFASPYHQEADMVTKPDGQGMGLYLVKMLTELHHGSISADVTSAGCHIVLRFKQSALDDSLMERHQVQFDLKQLVKMELSDIRPKVLQVQNNQKKRSVHSV